MTATLLNIVALLIFVLIPCLMGLGVLTLRKNCEPFQAWELPALSYAMGFAVWALVVLVSYLFQGAVLLTVGIYGVMILLLFVPFLRGKRRGRRIALLKTDAFDLGILVGASFLAVAYYGIGAYQDPSADSFRHLTFIRKIYESGTISKEAFFFSANVPFSTLTGNYVYEVLYPLYAGISKIFGIDPAVLWFHAPAALIPIFVSAFYLLASRMFRRRSITLVTLAVLLFYVAFVSNSGFRGLGQPYQISSVGYLVLMAEWFRSSAEKEWNWAGLAAFSIWGASLLLSHAQWWAYLLVTLGVLCVHSFFRGEIRVGVKNLALMTGVVLFSMPIFAARLPFYGAVSRDLGMVTLDRYTQELYRVGDLFAFDPFHRFKIQTWILICVALVVLISAGLRGYRKVNPGGTFAALVIAIIVFVMVNPVLVPIIAKLATINTVSRMETLAAFWGILMLSFSIVSVWSWIREQGQCLPRVLRRCAPDGERKAVGRIDGGAWFHKSDLLRAGIPVLSVSALLLMPGSELNPLKAAGVDRFNAQLYGPNISQVTSQIAFKKLFDSIPQQSVVLTDAMNLLLAFRDIKILGDVHGVDPQAAAANQFIKPIFELKTPLDEVLRRFLELRPDYFMLSPQYSHLAWMKYDRYPEVFQKTFDSVIPGIDHYNNRFVIYKLDLAKISSVLKGLPGASFDASPSISEVSCVPERIVPRYRFEIPPSGWDRTGDELHDGDWMSTKGSLMWLPLRKLWFYVDLDFDGEFVLRQVVVRNKNFTKSYHINGLALYLTANGSNFDEVKTILLPDSPGVGEHQWEFLDLHQKTRSARLAIYSAGRTTLGEVELYGCPVHKNGD